MLVVKCPGKASITLNNNKLNTTQRLFFVIVCTRQQEAQEQKHRNLQACTAMDTSTTCGKRVSKEEMRVKNDTAMVWLSWFHLLNAFFCLSMMMMPARFFFFFFCLCWFCSAFCISCSQCAFP